MRRILPALIPLIALGALALAVLQLGFAVEPEPAAAAEELSGEADGGGAAAEAAAAVRALAAAYPDRIREAARRDGDWAVRIEDTWYFWAGGRLLPEPLRAEWARFSPLHFYRYPAELPPPVPADPRTTERVRELQALAERSPPERHSGFLDHLYQTPGRAQTEARLTGVMFLGFPVRVHPRLLGPLAAVENRLRALSEVDPDVRRFLQGLKGLAGYNWRQIDGTRSRSYHSYGAAVDLVPRSYGRRHVYWRWSMPHVEAWYAIPHSERWLPPQTVVRAFEAQGFVWGGKWFFFDTIHFEYRPEIFLFSSGGWVSGE